jgi:arylsulfate sulfotransferase
MKLSYLKLSVVFVMILATSGLINSQDLVLPANFPAFTIDSLDNPDTDYLFMFARPQDPVKYPGYLIIMDQFGIPVYYKHLPYQSGLFKIQDNGLISFLRNDEQYSQVYIMDSSFHTVDSVWMENYKLDSHDFIAMENGHFLIFGLEYRIIDMSAVVPGGQVDATVEGCVIQELDENNDVVFEWNSFDHFEITDTYKDHTTSSITVVHPNSLEIDTDSNILMIARAMDEITKIDRKTGDIIWRLGGKNNQFNFADTSHAFSMPHSIRSIGDGHYTLFDNGTNRDPQYSRAIEYFIDEDNMTIEKVWEYDAYKTVFSRSGGSTQRLSSGNTLVCYGGQISDPSIREVHADGSMAFSLGFTDPNIRVGSVTKSPWKTNMFSANKDTVKFGQWDGYTSSLYYLRVKNHSDKDIELSNYHLHTNAFTIQNGVFPITLTPGEEKTIDLYYYPQDIDSSVVNDVLTINSDINSDTLVQRVAAQVHLTGTKIYTSPVESNSSELLRVYPNPASDWLTISSPILIKGQVSIFTINGTLVFEKEINDSNITIDLRAIDKGMYIIEISDKSLNKLYRRKIVRL